MNLLFDIGGTTTRLVVSSNGETIETPIIFATPEKFDDAMQIFADEIEKLTNGEKIEKSAGGIRRLNSEKSSILPDFRLPDWSGKPLKLELEKITGGEVFLENDTALVGLGEALNGAGKGKEIVMYMSLSSGIGGVRIVDGKIDKNANGFEPGQQIIDADWTMFTDIKDYATNEGLGQFEAYASGSSLAKRYKKNADELNDPNIWGEVIDFLSVGIGNAVLFWSPNIVILGGGMMKSPNINPDVVKEKILSRFPLMSKIPEIKKAELSDIGGLYGALRYLMSL